MANYKLMVNENKVKGLALNGKILYKDEAESAGSAPMNVKDIILTPNSDGVDIMWDDPDDTYDADGTLLAKWAGTKVVYKTTGWPTSPTDGTLAIDSTIRDAYKTNKFTVGGLIKDTVYYFSFFTYSDKNVINYNEANRKSVKAGIPNVTFADGTDEEIAGMLDAHYKGDINISDYWHVGDTRVMHLSMMSATRPYASESHVEQNMTMVIIGIEHDNLKESVNGKTKAAITLQCKELLGNNGTEEYGYIWGIDTQTSSDSGYSQNPRRTWLNDTFINSLPSVIQSLVKTVIKKNLLNHGPNNSTVNTEDKAFLTSYTEMFGNVTRNDYMGGRTPNNEEGEQYTYYNSAEKRTKYINNNGTASSDYRVYWLRSPNSSGSGTIWFVVHNGNVYFYSSSSVASFAPAFCL